MLKPVGLIGGHTEVRSRKNSLPIFQELLSFEIVDEREGEMTLRHPRTPGWPLTIHERPDSENKPVMNHYGVRVQTNEEVNRAWDYIKANKERYHLGRISKPIFLHLSWCFFTEEPGGNHWEIESYEKAIAEGRGGIAQGHWDLQNPLGQEHGGEKSYVVQAFTHGTLECGPREHTLKFYENVLGLDTSCSPPQPMGNVHPIYFKHKDTPWYVVVLPNPNRNILGKNQRFTLGMALDSEVEEAHRWFREEGAQLGISELEDLRSSGNGVSFLFSDLDSNWWEISSALT